MEESFLNVQAGASKDSSEDPFLICVCPQSPQKGKRYGNNQEVEDRIHYPGNEKDVIATHTVTRNFYIPVAMDWLTD